MATLLQGIRRHSLPLLALWGLSALVTADKTFNIVNGCPSAITIYVNGDSRGSVAAGATIVNTVADNWTGFIYSNVNAPDGNTGAGTTKAGFVNQVSVFIPAAHIFFVTYRLAVRLRLDITSSSRTSPTLTPECPSSPLLPRYVSSPKVFILTSHPFIYFSEQWLMPKGNLQLQVLRQHVH
jgi:hypothetical protein